jgi:hypothetical protein
MSANKGSCGFFCKAFYGKQKNFKCSGPCFSRFRLSCLQVSETEYNYCMDTWSSTPKGAPCMQSTFSETRRCGSKDACICTSDTPKEVSSLTKVISPERAFVLPPVFDGANYEVQIIQHETTRPNGLRAITDHYL